MTTTTAPVRRYETGTWVLATGKPGKVTACTDTEATVKLLDHSTWTGPIAEIPFGVGDAVQVDDRTNGTNYIGTVVAYWRNNTWTVRDNAYGSTCSHYANAITRRPELPEGLDPADVGAYRAALTEATDRFGLTPAQAGELVEIVYWQGVWRESPVIDVIDALADAAPDVDSVIFAASVASLFGVCEG